MYAGMSVAAVIPARDEAGAIERVVEGLCALRNAQHMRVVDRIIVVDNASRDDTATRALSAGAAVLHQPDGAYGAACLRGMAAATSADIVLFVDGDDSCAADEAIALLDAIANGADLALGARLAAQCERGAMTFPQRFGTRLAVALIAWFWDRGFHDLGPFRAMRATSLQALQMSDRRFGWTTEMQVKALLAGQNIVEVPVTARRRIGRSKISGTLKGTLLAGRDIIGTILRLRLQQWRPERAGEGARGAQLSALARRTFGRRRSDA